MQAVLHAERGQLHFGTQSFRAAFGKGGIRSDKQEGDGATPVGVLTLRRVLYRADRLAKPVCHVPLEPLARDDGWCDDPGDSAYNTHVHLPYPARHEVLWRKDGLYDLIGILGWNDAPVVPGRGSAIFLHVASADYAPTDGCIALSTPDMRTILAGGLTGILIPA